MDSHEQLMKRLSSPLLQRVDPRVVQDMVMYFANQLPFADDELLSRLYGMAAASPHSSTKASLKAKHGLVFNGPFGGGIPARCVR